MADSARRLYRVKDAAAVLDLSEATIYRLCKQRKIPHRKVAGVGISFTDADIDEILEGSYRPAIAS